MCVASYYPYKPSHTANFSFKGFMCKHAYKEREERGKKGKEIWQEGDIPVDLRATAFFLADLLDRCFVRAMAARGAREWRRRGFRRDVYEIITRGSGKFFGKRKP